MSQGERLVLPGGNEFVGDVTVETGFENGVHDGGIVDFLLVVQFRSPGVSCYVIMANEVLYCLIRRMTSPFMICT